MMGQYDRCVWPNRQRREHMIYEQGEERNEDEGKDALQKIITHGRTQVTKNKKAMNLPNAKAFHPIPRFSFENRCLHKPQ
eukprot:CCRYP_006809-RA/>CCRYP_006809-RA protein AED:0.43 eAED:0.43 QI:483/1/1/1/0/0/2/149/79